MTEKQYKIINDNLGEYSVLRPDGSIVSTEIQNKAEAELFCDELNELLKESEELQNKVSSWKITASEEISEKGELVKQMCEVKEENEQLKQSLNDLKHEIHHLKHEQKCLIKDMCLLTAPEFKQLVKENEQLKELLELISRATSFTKEESVKEILRQEIEAIDTVTEDSATAWHDYGLLSNFFKKQYGEHWDNE